MFAPAIQRIWGWLPSLAALLLVILLAESLAKAFWAFYPSGSESGVLSTVNEVPPPQTTNHATDVGKLVNAHLFGRFEAQKTAPVAKLEVIPETRLKLALKGVIFDNEHRATQAIISEAGRRDKTYRVGDELPGGAELTEIYPQRIILIYRGRHETLRLNPRYATVGAAGVAQTRPRDSGRRIDHRRNSRMTRELGRIRNSFITDPQTMAGLLRAVPVRRKGQFQGFRLAPGRDRGLLKRFGLRTGDMVKSVNGIELDSPSKALGLLGRIPEMQQLQVEIMRGNNRLSYVFNVGR